MYTRKFTRTGDSLHVKNGKRDISLRIDERVISLPDEKSGTSGDTPSGFRAIIILIRVGKTLSGKIRGFPRVNLSPRIGCCRTAEGNMRRGARERNNSLFRIYTAFDEYCTRRLRNCRLQADNDGAINRYLKRADAARDCCFRELTRRKQTEPRSPLDEREGKVSNEWDVAAAACK